MCNNYHNKLTVSCSKEIGDIFSNCFIRGDPFAAAISTILYFFGILSVKSVSEKSVSVKSISVEGISVRVSVLRMSV